MFISITDFDIHETDKFSHILITVLDSMSKPEQIKRLDKKAINEWIQVGFLKVSNCNQCAGGGND